MAKTWSVGQGGVLPGGREAPPIQDAPQLATILDVDADGATFELDLTLGHSYGPAPWSLGSHNDFASAITAGWKPRPGDRAAVLFCGAGLDNPVISAWWR